MINDTTITYLSAEENIGDRLTILLLILITIFVFKIIREAFKGLKKQEVMIKEYMNCDSCNCMFKTCYVCKKDLTKTVLVVCGNKWNKDDSHHYCSKQCMKKMEEKR